MAERPDPLAAEIVALHRTWRGRFLDLAVVALVLGYIRRIVTLLKPSSGPATDWKRLRIQGDSLGRRRALFVAAEAAGQLPQGVLGEQREVLRENLGALIREGNSLQKVRALRAMRFIASAECIPHLEQGLKDDSSWVQATALHTLFRLGLQDRKVRLIVRQFLFDVFGRSVAAIWQLTAEIPTEAAREAWTTGARGDQSAASAGSGSGGIFAMSRGLVAGLFKECGGKLLALLAIVLWNIALLWAIVAVVTAIVLGFALFAITLGVKGLAFLLRWVVCLPTAPIVARVRLGLITGSHWRGGALNVALDYVVALVAYFVSPHPFGVGGVAAFAILLLMTLFFEWDPDRGVERSTEPDQGADRTVEDLLGAIRFILLAYTTFLQPLQSGAFWLFLALTVAQVLGIALHLIFLYRTGSVRNNKLVQTVGLLGIIVGGVAFAVLVGFPGLILVMLVLVILWPVFLLGAEPYLVESIRILVLSGRRTSFENVNDYMAYICAVAKDSWYPVWVRARAVLALSDIALASERSISRLMDLAEDDLPPRVKDALFQVVEAAEKRLLRGQKGTEGFELSAAARVVPTESPGTILRPKILVGLLMFDLLALLSALSRRPEFASLSFTEAATLAELVLGIVLSLAGAILGPRRPAACLFGLVAGLGLVWLGMAYPLQAERAAWNRSFPVSDWFVFDWSTYWSMVFPVWFAIVGSLVGHLLYLLVCDVPVELDAPVRETSAAAESAPDSRPGTRAAGAQAVGAGRPNTTPLSF